MSYFPFHYDPYFYGASHPARFNGRRLGPFSDSWRQNPLLDDDEDYSNNNTMNDDRKQLMSSNKNQSKALSANTGLQNNSSLGLLWGANSVGNLDKSIQLRLDDSDPNMYKVLAKIPNFRKDQLQLKIKDSKLTVSGEVREEQKGDDFHNYSTRFVSRTITLPSDIDEDHISAKYESDGLVVKIPKASKHRLDKKEQILIE